MRLILAAALATVFASAASAETLTILHTNDFHSRIEPISKYNSGCRAGDNEKGKCFGVNACKGKSACKTAQNACQGHNACKGQGFLVMTEKKCVRKGGSFQG